MAGGKYDIGPVIGIEGEAEYRQQLQQVNESMRLLGSEMERSVATFNENSNSIEALTEQSRILQRQFDTQTERVNVMRTALERAVEEYGEGSSQVNRYQTSLNRAEAQLISTGNELNNTNARLEEVRNGTQEAESSFNMLGRNGVIANEALINSLDRVSGVVTKVIGSLVGLVTNAALAADDLNTLSKQTGIATDDLQKFQYATDLIDVSMDTLTGSMAKMIKNIGNAAKGTGDASAAFKELHIQIKNQYGELKNSNTIFYETIEALGRVKNETERDILAMQIFGKSAADLNPLILGGAKALKELGDEAERNGLIMSQETLNGANQLKDALDKLKATMHAVALSAGAELAISLTDLLPAIEPILNSIASLVGVVASIPPEVLVVVGTLMVMIPAALSAAKAFTTISQFMALFNPQAAKTTLIIMGVVIALTALAAAIAVVMGRGKELQGSMSATAQAMSGVQQSTHGVKAYATGTNWHPGGLALVGEEGPEIINLPEGSSVTNAPKTQKMLQGRGTTVVNYNTFKVDDIGTYQKIQKKLESERITQRAGYVGV